MDLVTNQIPNIGPGGQHQGIHAILLIWSRQNNEQRISTIRIEDALEFGSPSTGHEVSRLRARCVSILILKVDPGYFHSRPIPSHLPAQTQLFYLV